MKRVSAYLKCIIASLMAGSLAAPVRAQSPGQPYYAPPYAQQQPPPANYYAPARPPQPPNFAQGYQQPYPNNGQPYGAYSQSASSGWAPNNAQLDRMMPSFAPGYQPPRTVQPNGFPGSGFAPGYTQLPVGGPPSAEEQRVERLEKTAFGSTYPEHDVDDRVEHLEREEFGKASDGDLKPRIDRLESKLGGGAFSGAPSSGYTPPPAPPPAASTFAPPPAASSAPVSAPHLRPASEIASPGTTQLPPVAEKSAQAASAPAKKTPPPAAHAAHTGGPPHLHAATPTMDPSATEAAAPPAAPAPLQTPPPIVYKRPVAPEGFGMPPQAMAPSMNGQPFAAAPVSSAPRSSAPMPPAFMPQSGAPPSRMPMPPNYSAPPRQAWQPLQQQMPVSMADGGNERTASDFQTAVASIPFALQAGDYFLEIKRFPGGACAHWQSFPVRVHIPFNTPEPMRGQLENAVRQWGQVIPVMILNTNELADIEVAWISHLPPRQLGITNLEIFDGRMRVTIYLLRPKDYPAGVSASTLSAVALHELGHALGLWGHSQSAGDAMVALDTVIAKPAGLSPRDLNTLRQVYMAPGLPNGYQSEEPFSLPFAHYAALRK